MLGVVYMKDLINKLKSNNKTLYVTIKSFLALVIFIIVVVTFLILLKENGFN
jgi:ABC-type microcin C transport system permease subunit YejE